MVVLEVRVSHFDFDPQTILHIPSNRLLLSAVCQSDHRVIGAPFVSRPVPKHSPPLPPIAFLSPIDYKHPSPQSPYSFFVLSRNQNIMTDIDSSVTLGDQNFEDVAKPLTIDDCDSFNDIIFQPSSSAIGLVVVKFRNPPVGLVDATLAKLPPGTVFE